MIFLCLFICLALVCCFGLVFLFQTESLSPCSSGLLELKSVDQAGLPLVPECCNERCVPPQPALGWSFCKQAQLNSQKWQLFGSERAVLYSKWTYSIAQAGPELVPSSYLSLISARIKGMSHHAQTMF